MSRRPKQRRRCKHGNRPDQVSTQHGFELHSPCCGVIAKAPRLRQCWIDWQRQTRLPGEADQIDLPLRKARPKAADAVWQRRLSPDTVHWYIRVHLGGKRVVRVAGGAVTREGALEFMESFKAAYARTGKIPGGNRERETAHVPPAERQLHIAFS